MTPVSLPDPIGTITLNGQPYAVGALTRQDFAEVWGSIGVAMGKFEATEDERRKAEALLAFVLLRRNAPSLTLEFVLQHLTQEESIRTALEYRRQSFFILSN